MVEIFRINLASNHEAKLWFRHGGAALPSGLSDLNVRDETGGWWKFKLKSEGDNWFSISGSGWTAFAKNKINYTVTLYKNDDSYSITVR